MLHPVGFLQPSLCDGSLTQAQYLSQLNTNEILLPTYQFVITYHSRKQLRTQTPRNLFTFDMHDEICLVPFGLLRLETAGSKHYGS